MPDEVEFLKRLYDQFNARDMEKLLAAMQEEVLSGQMEWKAVTSTDARECVAIGHASGQ